MRQYIWLYWTVRIYEKKNCFILLCSFLPLFAQEVMTRIELQPSMLPVSDLHMPFQGTGVCDTPTAL